MSRGTAPSVNGGRPRGPYWPGLTGPVDRSFEASAKLSQVIWLFWRHRRHIVGLSLAAALLATLLISQTTPRYTASSTVMMEQRRNLVVDIEAVLEGLPADVASIQSQIEIIQSHNLLAQVAATLGLELDPEFNPALRPPGGLSSLLDLRQALPETWAATLFGPDARGGGATVNDLAGVSQESIVESLRDAVSVTPVGDSRAIRIAVESESARKAAAIANAIADQYVVSQLDAVYQATERASAWLTEQVAVLRSQVAQSDQAVESYRQANGLLQGARADLTREQVSDLSRQLILEQGKRAEAEARLRQIEGLLASSGAADSVSEVLSSPLIVSLREQEAKVKRRLAELGQEYGDKHPRLVSARAELRNIEEKIEREVERIVTALRGEAGVARAREESLRSALNALKARASEIDAGQVGLRALEREAEANRALLKTVLARSKEVRTQGKLLESDATVLSRAAVPTSPSAPRKVLLLAIAVLCGIALGTIVAVLRESSTVGFLSTQQAEAALGRPVLGLLPATGSLFRIGRPPEQELRDGPGSAYTEAIRSLRVMLAFGAAKDGPPPKVLLIASSLPREGKTSTALSLAELLGHFGQSAVLVDCDLRRPAVHRKCAAPLTPGLTDCLTGDLPVDAVLRTHEPSGLAFVTAGSGAKDPAGLLGSDRMAQLLERLAQRFDMVLLDSSPLLAVSDTRALARIAEKTLFLVRWAHTEGELAKLALRHLAEAKADVAGVVLTRVDRRRLSEFGLAESVHYAPQLRKYYGH